MIPGLATGIGSLPYTDPAQAAAAVLDVFPGLPSAPQLPNRSPQEGMLAQVARFVPGVSVAPDGELVRAPGAQGTDRLDPEAWASLFAFLDAAKAFDVPRIKVQCVGPLTLGLALTYLGFDTNEAFRLAVPAVRACIQALETTVAGVLPDADVVVFVDEPALVAWTDADGPIDRESAVDVLSGALAAVTGISGVHVCGPGDRRLALDAGPDILAIEARPTVLEDAAILGRFLDDDGWIAWGAVPTDRPIGDSADPLWRTLVSSWCECTRSGFDPVRVRAQAILTPACGLATHTVPQAQHAMDLAAALAARVHEQAAAARLTLGA